MASPTPGVALLLDVDARLREDEAAMPLPAPAPHRDHELLLEGPPIMTVVQSTKIRHHRGDPRCCEHKPPRNWWQRLRARLTGRRRCGMCEHSMNGGMVDGPDQLGPGCPCFIRGRR